MLQQHGVHVFSLSTSPHRSRNGSVSSQSYVSTPTSILAKPRRSTSSNHSTTQSPSSPSPSPRAYQNEQWTLLCIARPMVTTSRGPARSSTLTVTLLYHPTQTLYAWPFNLAGNDAKGTCYITPFLAHPAAEPVQPPAEALSISIRVLTDVVRTWMARGYARSAPSSRRNSLDSSKSSASIHVEQAEVLYGRRASSTASNSSEADREESIADDINGILGLLPIERWQRLNHLARQKLPCAPVPTDQEVGSLASAAVPSMSHASMNSPSSRSSDISSSELSTKGSDSAPSSAATTPDTTAEATSSPLDVEGECFVEKQASPAPLSPARPKRGMLKTSSLPKLDTHSVVAKLRQQARPCSAMASSCDDDEATPKAASPGRPFNQSPCQSGSGISPQSVPQIRLVEATPQESHFEEREQVLRSARRPSLAKRSSTLDSLSELNGDEDEEDANGAVDLDVVSTEVARIAVHPCDRVEKPSPTTNQRTAALPNEDEECGKARIGRVGSEAPQSHDRPGNKAVSSSPALTSAFAQLAASASVAAIAVANVEAKGDSSSAVGSVEQGPSGSSSAVSSPSTPSLRSPRSTRFPRLLKRSSMDLRAKLSKAAP